MTIMVREMKYKKLEPKIISYRNYKDFDNEKFRHDVKYLITQYYGNATLSYDNREFTQRQEYDYDYVNGRIKLQTQHYFTGIPFKSYRNPFYITVKQQITVIAI